MPADVLPLVINNDNKWRPGQTLRWCFVEQTRNSNDVVTIKQAFRTWQDTCNIFFEQEPDGTWTSEVTDPTHPFYVALD
jgi:hypothetical protein